MHLLFEVQQKLNPIWN